MSSYYSVQPTNFLKSSLRGEDRKDMIGFPSGNVAQESSMRRSHSQVSSSLPQSSPLLYSCLMNEQACINGYKMRQKNNGYSDFTVVGTTAAQSAKDGVSGSIPVVEFGPGADRPRSHSMVSMSQQQQQLLPSAFQISPSPSGSSCDSLLEDGQPSHNKAGSTEEVLVEATCNRFKRLSTRGGDSPSGSSPVSQLDESVGSHSPPTFDYDVVRKFSIGSQLPAYKRQISRHDYYRLGETESGLPGLPMDLTCKRKKSDATSASLDCLSNESNKGTTPDGRREDADIRTDAVNRDESINRDDSILKSVLVGMGRKRSHTLSVCGRPNFRFNTNNSSSSSSSSISSRGLETSTGSSFRQRMTLAKRTLGPVTGRVSEYLNKINQMLISLPSLQQLSSDDRRSLVLDSVHRLLMLYAAEDNLQFVVTAVRDDGDVGSAVEDGTPSAAAAADGPTRQFTDSVQNFISKCQAMNITPDEYIYMRHITLFHTGSSRVLERMDLIEKANSEGQQALQVLVQRSYPDDRLRYSKLLLTLYTLYGINGSMLEALLCRHLIPAGRNLQEFVYEEFLANRTCAG